MPYIWAAYVKGSLASMGGVFSEATMDAEEFRTSFTAEVADPATANYHGAWTVFGQTTRGMMPVGLILGFWSHPDPGFAPFMIVGDMLWFPWSSPRTRIESAVNFFNLIRYEFPMVDYSRNQDKRFFEIIAKHGIMRRVGTSYNVYPGEPATIFETRAP